MKAAYVAAGVPEDEAAAKAASEATSETTKMLQETAANSAALMAYDVIAGVSMYEILTSRYADGR